MLPISEAALPTGGVALFAISICLLEERGAEIRSVNCDVAQSARLEKAGLVVERRRTRRAAETRCGVTLQAEQVHVAELEHVGVGPAMNHVAGGATIDLHRCMLVHEGTLLIGVALETNRVLRGGHTDLFGQRRSVDIVAIGALNQPLIDAMVKGHGELGLLLKVAGEAKLGLRLGKQVLGCFGVMRRVAGNAAHVVLVVE